MVGVLNINCAYRCTWEVPTRGRFLFMAQIRGCVVADYPAAQSLVLTKIYSTLRFVLKYFFVKLSKYH